MRPLKLLGTLFFLSQLLQPNAALAAKFANQFIEFELPPQWQCVLEGSEWVCQSTVEAKKRDAIIVLAAKLKGDQDSLDQYLTRLKTPKHWVSVKGQAVVSEMKYAKTADINGQPWVDSLHLGSELVDFYTRYLASIKSDIAVLVTYSINKNKYQDYLQDLENMVKTLKVFRKPGGINAGPASGNLFGQIAVPQDVSQGTVFPGAETPEEKPKSKDNSSTLYLMISGAAVAFFIWKRRQNSG